MLVFLKSLTMRLKTMMKVKLSEGISEIELSRGDWINVMHKSGNTFWKWLQKEDKILSNRSHIFRKFKPPEIAGSWGHFIFNDVSTFWVCITLFLHVNTNCLRSVLLIFKNVQDESRYLNNILRSKNRLTGKFSSHCILSLDIRFIIASHLGSIELSGLIKRCIVCMPSETKGCLDKDQHKLKEDGIMNNILFAKNVLVHNVWSWKAGQYYSLVSFLG